MDLQAYINSITFRSSLSLDLGKGDILVVIGPNNAGKSAALKDILALIERGVHGVVVTDLELTRLTPEVDLLAWVAPFAGPTGNVNLAGTSFHLSMIKSWWSAGQAIGPFLTSRLVANLTTRERLGDCDPQTQFDRRQPYSAKHPFQHFFKDDALEKRASALFRRAFKKDFVIHRGAGNIIPAYVGDRPKLGKGEHLVSSGYLDRIEALDKVEQQGDGMRSFASILGRVLAETKSILLIDEPEAFLHPPQARMIADIIATEASERQTFIASHSREVLQGLLAKHAARVSIVRLSRRPGQGGAVHLQSSAVAELWKDPILRFSNILDGLFHDAVIVTEADADCRFYEAVAAAVLSPEDAPDIHYTYSGGKDRIPVVVKALRALEVPVASIVDFDVLNDEQPLRRIVEAHGGLWAAVQPDWHQIKGAVEQNAQFVGADQFKAELSKRLKAIKPGGAVDRAILADIRRLTRNASPWDVAKRSGLASLPNGPAAQAAKRLLAALRTLNIYVCPDGEMEGFCRTEPHHGPRWVEEVLKRDLASDGDLSSARAFMTDILEGLKRALR